MSYTVHFRGITADIITKPGIFSERGPDRGTMLMLDNADISPGMRILDLGCGSGIVGTLCAKLGAEVFMLDCDPLAVDVASRTLAANGISDVVPLLSDGFADFKEKDLDLILSNPPYHTDFSVAKGFIEKGFNRLRIGGRMMLVVKRPQWYHNKLCAIFGGCTQLSKEGYTVFTAIKRQSGYARTSRR